MGKKKGKTPNIFKVAGAKSLKAKKKAKAVNTQLKKMSKLTKDKTEESNRQFSQVEEAIRQTTTVVKKSATNVKKDMIEIEKLAKETDETAEENVEKMKSINV